MMQKHTTTSEEETQALAASLAPRLRPGDVLAFRGGLGAGKTAFIRGLVQGLGIHADVSSPTFALVHEYREGEKVLYHFDFYRVTDFESLYSTGFFDYLDTGGIIAAEWSENIENALPEDAITVTISTTGETTREITLEGGGRF